MLDKITIKIVSKPLDILARVCIWLRLSPTAITLISYPFAIIAFICILFSLYNFALICIIVNRILDGLDGKVARITHTSSVAGGYIDIIVDFWFYGLIPLAHGIVNPAQNLLPASLVLFSYVLSGVNFMASSSAASALGLKSIYPQKKLYYPLNLIEGTETIFYIIFVTLIPSLFPIASYIMAGLIIVTMPITSYIRYRYFHNAEKSSIDSTETHNT